MRKWIGKFISNCVRSYHDSETLETPRPRMTRTLEERVGNHTSPSVIAYKISNGFIIDSPAGMVYCADAKTIAEAVVASEAKQKIGLKTIGYPQESNAAQSGF